MNPEYAARTEIINWLKTNNFCAMPFFHVAIESNGDVRPCCLGDPLKNPDGSTLNIAGKSIQEVIDHPTHIKFRESFLKNEQHPSCHQCWGSSHSDIYSGRMTYSTSRKIGDYTHEIMKGCKPEQKLLWLEIKAGNRCNLACRICGLWNSAKWLKETYDIKKSRSSDNYPAFKDSPEYAYNQQSKWIDDINFWKNIDGFDEIKVIHLMGGEPLMIEEHYEMLKAIADKFDPSKIMIWYNTNGTVIPTAEQEEILSKFQQIHWSLSIDDMGDRFDYQRSGASWSEVKENIPYFFSKDNYDTVIDATISIYNILTINEFIDELNSMGIADRFQPHFVNSKVSSTCVRTLKKEVKEQIAEVLRARSSFNSQQIEYIINFMLTIDWHSDSMDQQRKYEIDLVDKSRNENFLKVFPEMSRLLGYE